MQFHSDGPKNTKILISVVRCYAVKYWDKYYLRNMHFCVLVLRTFSAIVTVGDAHVALLSLHNRNGSIV